jgi:ATP adenylyltransferase
MSDTEHGPPGAGNPLRPLFEPGTLWERVVRRTEEALASGALRSIPTESEVVHEQGLSFLIRVVANLERRDRARGQPQAAGEPTDGGRKLAGAEDRAGSLEASNPFLPYDDELYVADVSPTHVALLNKFNVVKHHLLIVTRVFEHQERPLGETDFDALWRCLGEVDGLGFYNGGEIAGASQPHKHLQIASLPLDGVGPRIPLEPALEPPGVPGTLGASPRLPFGHCLTWFPEGFEREPKAPGRLLAWYRGHLESVGLAVRRDDRGPRVDPYNLLLSRRWMLTVPRSNECFEGISLNALAFAGSLLVRRWAEADLLKRRGCMAALAEVTLGPWR